MIFISERIINISDLEALLSAARLNHELLISELQKETPRAEKIQNLSYVVRNILAKAENFEFCIEKRKCIFKEDSENPICQENPINVDNQV